MNQLEEDSLVANEALGLLTAQPGTEAVSDGTAWNIIVMIFHWFVSRIVSLIPLPAILHFCRAFAPEAERESSSDPAMKRPRGVSLIVGFFALGTLFAAAWFLSFLAWGVFGYFGQNPFRVYGELSEEASKAAFGSIAMLFLPFVYTLEFLFVSLADKFPERFELIGRLVRRRMGVLGNVVLFGLSLLPLSVFILALPAISPNEAVLSETVKPVRTRLGSLFRRLVGVLTALAALVVLVAVSVEIVSFFNLPKNYISLQPAKLFPAGLLNRLPATMVEQWHYTLICVYLLDVLFLFAIGKVPLRYNFRNLSVRWLTTLMTGLAFTLVVALLIVMFSFINGLNRVTNESGIPGNVFVLSEGAVDEVFSNLGYGDINQLENERAETDRAGKPLAKPVKVKELAMPGGKRAKLVSKETYISVNHEIPPRPGVPPKRRLLALRAIQDAWVSGKVHNMELVEGEWFDDKPRISDDGKTTLTPCVLGQAAAAKFGEDVNAPPLKTGDTFKLGDLDMIVAGVMKSEGTTFGSEVWVRWERATQAFNKKTFTTVALRVEDDTAESADAMAAHLTTNFTNPRVRAVPETQYFEDLAKGSQAIFTIVLVIAAIMAIGGVFGVMNTMFASISQRVKDIGVLRILGFKRWQLLISFMLESLGMAILGGLLGCAIGYLVDGFKMDSTLSSGGPGGKLVTIRLTVDTTIIVCAILFTIIMGRLGGLVPSLSAMRMKILDSLR